MRTFTPNIKNVSLFSRVAGLAILLVVTLTVVNRSDDVAERHTGDDTAVVTVTQGAAHAGWALAVHVFDGNEAGGVFFAGAGAGLGAMAAKAIGKRTGAVVGGMIGGPVGMVIGMGLGAL